jgi:hypothetical protein
VQCGRPRTPASMRSIAGVRLRTGRISVSARDFRGPHGRAAEFLPPGVPQPEALAADLPLSVRRPSPCTRVSKDVHGSWRFDRKNCPLTEKDACIGYRAACDVVDRTGRSGCRCRGSGGVWRGRTCPRHALVTREKRATVSFTPPTERLRPGRRPPSQPYLAGIGQIRPLSKGQSERRGRGGKVPECLIAYFVRMGYSIT